MKGHIESIPNFLILGAAKCGTTSLYRDLSNHPDVFMSMPKEPMFFESEYGRGLSYYRDRYFIDYKGQSLVGEARVANLFLPYVPSRIKESLPHAKLIALLRHPVERAYSHWWMKFCRGYEKLSFDSAIQDNFTRIDSGTDFSGESGQALWSSCIRHSNPPHVSVRVYVDAGYYALQLERYFSLFPSKQIKILFFDDLVHRPRWFIKEISGFLHLDFTKFGNHPSRENASLTTALAPLLRLDQKICLSARLPDMVVRIIKRVLSRVGKIPTMKPETRKILLEHYYPYNLELETLLGRSFSQWNL